MRAPLMTALAAGIAVSLASVAIGGAVATCAAMTGYGPGDMWEMMGDMGGMHGMMGAGDGPETTGSASGAGDVTIADFRFEPTTFNVTPGTTVTWTNQDSAPHTATANDGSFDTGRLSQGDSASVRFSDPGTYAYYCEYHPAMEGTVVVAAE